MQERPATANPAPDTESTVDRTTPAGSSPQSGTGTGFKITDQGQVLTNFHVAGRCRTISLQKTGQVAVPAELVASDATNDLALVKSKEPLPGGVASFAGDAAPRAGSEIAVFGFPVSEVLSDSGNIVTGNITSLAGLGNDSRVFQISAPVQPGNSDPIATMRNESGPDSSMLLTHWQTPVHSYR